MKRILVASLLVLMATPAIADTVSFDSTATATRNWINNSLSTIYNEFNGSIDTDNLQAGAVTSLDIATAANPLVRDAENIGEYVYTGLLAPTATGLTATTTAGTAYVLNDGDSTLHRVVKAATAITFTLNENTWVYLGYDGSFTTTEVGLGGTQPTTPTNTILLCMVTTDGTDVTTVTDHRALAPSNLRTYEDYRTGLVLSRDVSDVDVVNIGRGEIEFGGTNGKVRRNTISADIDFGSSGTTGKLDTGSLAADTIYYIFAVADSSNSTDWVGIASLSPSDAATVTGEKLIGWCYASTASVISPDAVGAYKGTGSSAPNVYHAGASEAAITVTNNTSLVLHQANFYSSGGLLRITHGVTQTAGGAVNTRTSISADSTTNFASEVMNRNGAAATQTYGGTWYTQMDAGVHTFDLLYVADTGTSSTVDSWYLIIEEL